MKIIATREKLVEHISTLGIKGIGLEVGVQAGDFSDIILKKWKGCSKLYLMDAWAHQDESVYVDKANVSDIEQIHLMNTVKIRFNKEIKLGKVEVIQAFSPAGADEFEDNSFDFIYLDADHSYEAVKRDLHAWYPKLISGGIFAGHDYLMDKNWQGEYGIFGEFGVTKAVQEFAKEKNLRINNTMEFVCKSWWTIK